MTVMAPLTPEFPDDSNRLRILFVARAPFISGAERALLTLIRLFCQSGHTVGVILGTDSGFTKEVEDAGARVWVVRLPQRSAKTVLSWWRCTRRIRRIIADFKPDVLHANEVPACQAVSVVGRELKIPLVVHIRWAVTASELDWWAKGGASGVVCISKWVRDQLGDVRPTGLANAEVVVAPDPIDWTDTEPLDAAVRQTTTGIRLGFAGQLIAAKGIDVLIRALGQVPPLLRPQVFIAGRDTQTGGQYRAMLERLAEEHGVTDSINWLGFLADIRTLYQQVDAVVCPSRVEPLGLVPLEAARYRLPAIVNRVGGLAETVKDGLTGLIVPPTVEGWATRLATLPSKEQLAQLGESAYREAVTHYSGSLYRDELIALYNRLISRRKIPSEPHTDLAKNLLRQH